MRNRRSLAALPNKRLTLAARVDLGNASFFGAPQRKRGPLRGAPLASTVGDSMPHGKICYLEIPANTAEASANFYSSVFGWKVRKRGDGELAFDDAGGVSGTWVKQSDRTPDEHTRTYIMVDVIADTLKRIEAAGGRVLTPRTNIGSGMGAFAIFADPVGNEFGLYEEPTR